MGKLRSYFGRLLVNLTLAGVAVLYSVSAQAQDVTGVLGSPNATCRYRKLHPG
jgi:hypothetical protein